MKILIKDKNGNDFDISMIILMMACFPCFISTLMLFNSYLTNGKATWPLVLTLSYGAIGWLIHLIRVVFWFQEKELKENQVNRK